MFVAGRASSEELAQCELAVDTINANWPLANLTIIKTHDDDWNAYQQKIRQNCQDMPNTQFREPIVWNKSGSFVGYDKFLQMCASTYGVAVVEDPTSSNTCQRLAQENISEVMDRKKREKKGPPLMELIDAIYPQFVEDESKIERSGYDTKIVTKKGVQAILQVKKEFDPELTTGSKASIPEKHNVGMIGGFFEDSPETHHCFLVQDPIVPKQFAIVEKGQNCSQKTKYRYNGNVREKTTTFDVGTNNKFILSNKDWQAAAEALVATDGACTFQYSANDKVICSDGVYRRQKIRRHLSSYTQCFPKWEEHFPFATFYDRHLDPAKSANPTQEMWNDGQVDNLLKELPGLDSVHSLAPLDHLGDNKDEPDDTPLWKRLKQSFENAARHRGRSYANGLVPRNYSIVFTKDWMLFVPIALPGDVLSNDLSRQICGDKQMRDLLWNKLPPCDPSIFLGIVRMPKLHKTWPETAGLQMKQIVASRAEVENIRPADKGYEEAQFGLNSLRINKTLLEDPFIITDLWGWLKEMPPVEVPDSHIQRRNSCPFDEEFDDWEFEDASGSEDEWDEDEIISGSEPVRLDNHEEGGADQTL